MTNGKKGSLTIVLALTSMMFLIFCLVLTDGVRTFFLKWEAEQAMELAEFSVLSEYQQELFWHYGLFFLDLDYEQGTEQIGILESRARHYFQQNAEELTVTEFRADNFTRATDGGGISFFRQASEQRKRENGYKIFEELFERSSSLGEESLDLEEVISDSENQAEGMLDEYVDEEGRPMFQISIPKVSFPSVGALTEAVFGDKTQLSEKSIDLEERMLNRELCIGSGRVENKGLAEMQMFQGYLMNHFGYYGVKDPEIWKECLEYQIEYVIFGKSDDRENLEEMMWRIFLLRAAGNYLFFHQDGERIGKAEVEAAAIAGITGNPALIRLVREIILISQAIEEGIRETRSVFLGEKVPLYEQGMFCGISMGYEEYLYLFLSTTDQKEKIFRSMDIVELETRKKSGYEELRMDHCVDCFEFDVTWQFHSLFMEIPLLDGGSYENTMKKEVYYEM